MSARLKKPFLRGTIKKKSLLDLKAEGRWIEQRLLVLTGNWPNL